MTTASNATNDYERNSQMSRIGGLVKIPRGATGITVAPIEPFGDSVQVSWLQTPQYDWSRGANELRVNAERRPVEDEENVTLPKYAFSPSVFEPPGEDEAIIYWLG